MNNMYIYFEFVFNVFCTILLKYESFVNCTYIIFVKLLNFRNAKKKKKTDKMKKNVRNKSYESYIII